MWKVYVIALVQKGWVIFPNELLSMAPQWPECARSSGSTRASERAGAWRQARLVQRRPRRSGREQQAVLCRLSAPRPTVASGGPTSPGTTRTRKTSLQPRGSGEAVVGAGHWRGVAGLRLLRPSPLLARRHLLAVTASRASTPACFSTPRSSAPTAPHLPRRRRSRRRRSLRCPCCSWKPQRPLSQSR